MTDIPPPVSNERAAHAPGLGAPLAQGSDSIPSIAQGQTRIDYRYWLGAVVLGLMIWTGIFLAF